jgi:radical SAM-linked protein
MQRIRIYYAKTEPLRYTGNLDVHRVWERTLRRARLPLAYSQGFHPQPKINQASPLPLGVTSKVEVIDVWLDEDWTAEAVTEALLPAPQPGIEVERIEIVDLQEPALQTQVISAAYKATVLSDITEDQLQQSIDDLLSAGTLIRDRRGKTYDLRPLIEAIQLLQPDENGRPQLMLNLVSRAGATGRADEVLSALGIEQHHARIERVELIFEKTQV